MRFSLTDDQQLMGKAVRELLERECGPEALRAAWDGGGRVPGAWQRLAELGVLALLVPSERGGMGGDEVDVVPLLEEAGRVALGEPLIGTLAAVSVVDRDWSTRIASGDAVVAVGAGPGDLVADAEVADLLLLERDGALYAMPRDAVTVEPATAVDTAARLARVTWESTGATRLDAEPDDVFDRAALDASAQLVGVAQGMLDMAVRYAKEREQFGKPIGSFQAVKHQLADVYIGIEFARPVVLRAAWSVARSLPSRGRDVSHAKHAATEAAQRAARVALQVHAGIGYTYEHDLHMWLKRAWTLAALYGTASWHRARVARAVLDERQARVP